MDDELPTERPTLDELFGRRATSDATEALDTWLGLLRDRIRVDALVNRTGGPLDAGAMWVAIDRVFTASAPSGERLKDVVCPRCKGTFKLAWNLEDEPWEKTIELRGGAHGGGVCDITIRCPHCQYAEEL